MEKVWNMLKNQKPGRDTIGCQRLGGASQEYGVSEMKGVKPSVFRVLDETLICAHKLCRV